MGEPGRRRSETLAAWVVAAAAVVRVVVEAVRNGCPW